MNNDIENCMKELDNELKENKEQLNIIFKEGLNDEIKKGKYKTQIDKIFKFSFNEILKMKIYEIFGN